MYLTLYSSGCGRHVENLSSDIKDSVAYIHLLHQIAPRDNGLHTGCQNVSAKTRPEKGQTSVYMNMS